MTHVVVSEVLDLTARGRETLLDGKAHTLITAAWGERERERERQPNSMGFHESSMKYEPYLLSSYYNRVRRERRERANQKIMSRLLE